MPTSKPKSIHENAYRVLIECLREARSSIGVTQSDLAAKLGADQSYVSKYERFERRLDIIEVRAICIALSIEFKRFIEDFETALVNTKRKESQ